MNLIIIFCAKYLIFVISIITALFLLIRYGFTKIFLKNILIVFISSGFAWVFAHFLKDIIKNPRPDETLALIQDNSFSFPSGHTTFLSALGVSIARLDRKTGYWILLLALVVGFSRVLAGVHFWYDIVGGFILGILIVYLINKIVKTRY